MKIFLAFTIFIAFLSQTLTKVSRINQYVEEAQAAFNQKDYFTAIHLFRYLNDSLRVRDREVKINLGHAYFQRNNHTQAFKLYQPLLAKSSPRVSSILNLQLGVIIANDNKNQALDYFKKALILNPQNEEARYNYEFLKKYLNQYPEEAEPNLPPPSPEQLNPQEIKSQQTQETGQKEDDQGKTQAEVPDLNNADPENQPQPDSRNDSENKNPDSGSGNKLADKTASNNQQRNEVSGSLPGTQRGISGGNSNGDNRNQANGGQEVRNDPDTSGQTTFDHINEAGITPEKARMLLEVMREAEIQYLQQIPRKNINKNNKGKPNW